LFALFTFIYFINLTPFYNYFVYSLKMKFVFKFIIYLILNWWLFSIFLNWLSIKKINIIYIYIKEIVLFYFIEYLPSKPKINILTSFDPQRRFNKDENIWPMFIMYLYINYLLFVDIFCLYKFIFELKSK